MNQFKQLIKHKIKEYTSNPHARKKLFEKFDITVDPKDLIPQKPPSNKPHLAKLGKQE
jgi:hypothetical protein